jgi:hypothetical protein
MNTDKNFARIALIFTNLSRIKSYFEFALISEIRVRDFWFLSVFIRG